MERRRSFMPVQNQIHSNVKKQSTDSKYKEAWKNRQTIFLGLIHDKNIMDDNYLQFDNNISSVINSID